jgi:hypothetical protein
MVMRAFAVLMEKPAGVGCRHSFFSNGTTNGHKSLQ